MPPEEAAKKHLVVRHNRLIESRHKLTLTERRFMLWVVSQIRRDDDDLHTYSIRVKDWERFIGIKSDSNTYNEIYKMSDRLTKKNVGIQREDGKKKGFVFFPWFYRIEYIPGEGTLEAKIHPDLKPYLVQLKEQYTAIQLEYALLLRRETSHRIYDLLKQYEKIGSRTIELVKLREMLELEKKYSKYQDFRRYVLEKSQKEICEKTDISFDFEPVWQGRKIAAILFTITRNQPEVTLENSEEISPDVRKVFSSLVRQGIEEKKAREIVADYDIARIEWHIGEYERKRKNGEECGTGWLVQGIKIDYRPQQSIFEKEDAHRRQKLKEAREEEKRVQDEAESLRKECDAVNAKEREKIVSGLSEEEKAEILTEVRGREELRIWGKPESFDDLRGGKAVFQYELLRVIRERHKEKFRRPSEYARKKKKSKAVIAYLERLEAE